MRKAHICNTFFERELESGPRPLTASLHSHPIITQLQFLPLLYADADDLILVSDLPDDPDPRLCLLDNAPADIAIEHWGPSRSIADWAKSRNIAYKIPNWDLIRKVNSKVFSFTHSPKLPGAALLQTTEEINEWIAKTPNPKVLKTPFGTAATGHIHNPNVKPLYILPLIGEPWVERVMDFSTQWEDGKLLGVTLFENEPNGTYKGTFAGAVEEWALNEHLAVAEPLVEQVYKMGYTGHLGVDAFIYLWEGKQRVHPVVEINGRKTMSWVALQQNTKRLYYTQSSKGLLPNSLCNRNFSRNVLSG